MLDRSYESIMGGGLIQEIALSRQIEAAKWRASIGRVVYDSDSTQWKQVDELIKEREEFLERMEKIHLKNLVRILFVKL